ncbi:hypothetical protein SAMN05444406_1661, partial [Caldicoprobacter faecalis]
EKKKGKGNIDKLNYCYLTLARGDFTQKIGLDPLYKSKTLKNCYEFTKV